MMSRTRLLFDLDGTLTDNYPGISRSIVHALAGFGMKAPDEAALRHCVGPPLRETFARLLGTDDRARIESALARYRQRYAVDGWRENEPYPGIDQAIALLAAAGHRLYVCTSKPRVYAQRIVEHFGLARHFESLHGPELDGRFDDKAELMRHLLDAEGLDPAACVMIGDRAQDMRAARANGVDTLGVLWGYGSRAELIEAGASRIVERVHELAPAFAGDGVRHTAG
jgi:phosphoglycolate phosphatase